MTKDDRSYNYITIHCQYEEGNYISLPELNKRFKEYLMVKYNLERIPRDSININSILAIDKRFVHRRVHICKHCHNIHLKGCCNNYNRIERTTSVRIINIGYKQQMDDHLHETLNQTCIALEDLKLENKQVRE